MSTDASRGMRLLEEGDEPAFVALLREVYGETYAADRTRKRLSRSSVRDATRGDSREVDINSDLRPASGSPDSILLSR